ncbi:hypothetical protein NM688_g9303 [Phlebia brevispora]|uniref:Uncharacterized protein n=1 Tax=Phlebia brevispora TaxID=194682 RepID=A0ACC1RJS8_9APHY|nr:hypothetical protein NM688_g9303 [Phlebia brevispora]
MLAQLSATAENASGVSVPPLCDFLYFCLRRTSLLLGQEVKDRRASLVIVVEFKKIERPPGSLSQAQFTLPSQSIAQSLHGAADKHKEPLGVLHRECVGLDVDNPRTIVLLESVAISGHTLISIESISYSWIFYASNGEFHISYIDSLYNSVSAVTVCGLATVDLSSLTPWQQVILFIQMCVGSPVVVSWVMVYVRREIFASKFRHVVEAEMSRRVSEKVHAPVDVKVEPWWKRVARSLVKPQLSTIAEATHSAESSEERGRSLTGRLRPDMIRRMDDAPKLINPSGYISEGHTPDLSAEGRMPSADSRVRDRGPPTRETIQSAVENVAQETELELRHELDEQESQQSSAVSDKRLSQPFPDSGSEAEAEAGSPPANLRSPIHEFKTRNLEGQFPRTQTIEFALREPPERNRGPQDATRLERLRSPMDTRPPLTAARSRSRCISLLKYL